MTATPFQYKVRQRTLQPIGQCIYCGQKPAWNELTREHIFPFSLGGTLVLPKSSCLACAKITRDFEHSCARPLFGRMRILFGLPTGHKHERPKELDVIVQIGETQQVLMLPIEDCPAQPVFFPNLPLPGLLRGRDVNDEPGEPVWLDSIMPNLPDQEQRIARLRERIGQPFKLSANFRVPVGAFMRMLAKIAHASAVAEFGYGSFAPLLTNLILLRDDDKPTKLVGGLRGMEHLAKAFPHETTHRTNFGLVQIDQFPFLNGGQLQSKTYLICLVHLFIDLGSPAYLVVVGIPNETVVRNLEEYFPQPSQV